MGNFVTVFRALPRGKSREINRFIAASAQEHNQRTTSHKQLRHGEDSHNNNGLISTGSRAQCCQSVASRNSRPTYEL